MKKLVGSEMETKRRQDIKMKKEATRKIRSFVQTPKKAARKTRAGTGLGPSLKIRAHSRILPRDNRALIYQKPVSVLKAFYGYVKSKLCLTEQGQSYESLIRA